MNYITQTDGYLYNEKTKDIYKFDKEGKLKGVVKLGNNTSYVSFKKIDKQTTTSKLQTIDKRIILIFIDDEKEKIIHEFIKYVKKKLKSFNFKFITINEFKKYNNPEYIFYFHFMSGGPYAFISKEKNLLKFKKKTKNLVFFVVKNSKNIKETFFKNVLYIEFEKEKNIKVDLGIWVAFRNSIFQDTDNNKKVWKAFMEFMKETQKKIY